MHSSCYITLETINKKNGETERELNLHPPCWRSIIHMGRALTAKCWNMVKIISKATTWKSLGQCCYASPSPSLLFASPVDVPSHRRWSYALRRPGYCRLSWMTDGTVDGCRRLGWGDKRHHKYRWTLHSRSSLCKSRSYMNLVLACYIGSTM